MTYTDTQARQIQTRLKELGFYQGEIDGDIGPKSLGAIMAFQREHGLTVDGLVGPNTSKALFETHNVVASSAGVSITPEQLKAISLGHGKSVIVGPVAAFLNKWLPGSSINTKLRLEHFLAQASHESDHFKTLYEYWGPTSAQRGYEGRRDLGNTKKGDGYLFRGRGIFQLTGRANYGEYGDILGLDLVNHPELAAEPEHAVRLAIAYWEKKGLSKYADADDITEITRRINGGRNGLADRINQLAVAKRVI